MKEAFEKVKERLEEETYDMEICEEQFDADSPYFIDVPYKMVKLQDALSIVSEVEAEFGKDINVRGNGWIPCSERLPKEATVYEVTEEIIICSQKQYIVEHRLFGTEGEWLCPSNRKVIAWMPLPSPYKPTTD